MATWTAQRVAHHGILTLHGDVSQVFPLFRFDQEDRWADGWAYHPVYPADGRAGASGSRVSPGGAWGQGRVRHHCLREGR